MTNDGRNQGYVIRNKNGPSAKRLSPDLPYRLSEPNSVDPLAEQQLVTVKKLVTTYGPNLRIIGGNKTQPQVHVSERTLQCRCQILRDTI